MKTKRFIFVGGTTREDIAGGFRDFIAMSDDENELKKMFDEKKLMWFQIVDIQEFKRTDELVPRNILEIYGNRMMNCAIENKLELPYEN